MKVNKITTALVSSLLVLGMSATHANAKTNKTTVKPLILDKVINSKDGGKDVIYKGETSVSGTLKYNEEFCDLCFYLDNKSNAMIPLSKIAKDNLGEDGSIRIVIDEKQRAKTGLNTVSFGEEALMRGECYSQKATMKISGFVMHINDVESDNFAKNLQVVNKGKLIKNSCN